jgi:exodeoxyribonuclease VII large subunit
VDDRAERLGLALPNFINLRRGVYERLAARLIHPREILARRGAEISLLSQRLQSPLPNRLREAGLRLESLGARLNAVSYQAVLARGFALVTTAKGAPVTNAAAVPPGAALTLKFADGDIAVKAAGAQGTLPL